MIYDLIHYIYKKIHILAIKGQDENNIHEKRTFIFQF